MAHRTSGLTILARAWTLLGSTAVLTTLTVFAVGRLLLRRRVLEAVVTAVGMIGAAALTVAIKNAVARPRPPEEHVLGPIEHTFSFPSGHTLNSAVMVCLLAWAFVPAMTRRRRAVALFIATTYAVGVAATRIYLGVHWATDVLGSWLIATGWLAAIACVLTVPGVRGRASSRLKAKREHLGVSGASPV